MLIKGKLPIRSSWILLSLCLGVGSCGPEIDELAGKTEILKWPEGKKAAVSLTYDDGSVNQFRIALPLMDSLGFPATFYINTGQIPGSQFLPKFTGRSMDEIIRESAEIPTTAENLFERASLAAYAPYRGSREYHTRAGELVEAGNIQEACQVIEEGFEKMRSGKLAKLEETRINRSRSGPITWDLFKDMAGSGHEFGSHTISHPRLAAMDEANLLYELEKSREDILHFLGPDHTFSAECPYGTENERVMEYAYEIYPALRNRMPAGYLTELNRGSREEPGSFDTDYVQWQRGPLTTIPMALMKSWIDTCLVHENIWLVLVFHGVEGVGWEPKTRKELVEYFNYIKSREDELWVATFKDVTRYIRERMNAVIEVVPGKQDIEIRLAHSLGTDWYDYPLDLKTSIPQKWETVQVTQGGKTLSYSKARDEEGEFLLYSAIPNAGMIRITAE